MYSLIKYETKNRAAYITLNRPEKRNALSPELVFELKQAFSQAYDDDEAKVIVLQAEGKAFCSGADLEYLQQLQQHSFEENLQDSRNLKELFYQIYVHPKVVIAKVQGHAIAGGCGLATVCDFVYAAEEAKFGYTEVRIGFIPAIVKVFLLRKIGEARAKQLLLSGDLVSAEEACSLGLVNKVYPPDDLNQAVDDLVKNLTENNSGHSMYLTKQMIAEVQHMPLNEALDYAAQMNAQARESKDCKKGIGAFLDKQPLKW